MAPVCFVASFWLAVVFLYIFYRAVVFPSLFPILFSFCFLFLFSFLLSFFFPLVSSFFSLPFFSLFLSLSVANSPVCFLAFFSCPRVQGGSLHGQITLLYVQHVSLSRSFGAQSSSLWEVSAPTLLIAVLDLFGWKYQFHVKNAHTR